MLVSTIHCVNNVSIRSFSGPYFPAFGLNFFSFLSFAKILHSFFYNGHVSICKDLQKTIVLSLDPFMQMFTFTIQCISNL